MLQVHTGMPFVPYDPADPVVLAELVVQKDELSSLWQISVG